jgi:hypothetical protein
VTVNAGVSSAGDRGLVSWLWPLVASFAFTGLSWFAGPPWLPVTRLLADFQSLRFACCGVAIFFATWSLLRARGHRAQVVVSLLALALGVVAVLAWAVIVFTGFGLGGLAPPD